MIEINLIRGDALTKKIRDNIVKKATVFCAVSALILTTLIITIMSQSSGIQHRSEELSKLNSEIRSLSGRFRINEWQTGWVNLARNVSVVEAVYLEREEYASRLAAVKRAIPDEMHIHELTVTESDGIILKILMRESEDAALRVEGYKEKLERLDDISSIIIDEKQEMEVEENNMFLFRVSIR